MDVGVHGPVDEGRQLILAREFPGDDLFRCQQHESGVESLPQREVEHRGHRLGERTIHLRLDPRRSFDVNESGAVVDAFGSGEDVTGMAQRLAEQPIEMALKHIDEHIVRVHVEIGDVVETCQEGEAELTLTSLEAQRLGTGHR